MGTDCNRCKQNEGIIMYKMWCGHHNCTTCIDKNVDMSLPIRLYQCPCGIKSLIGKDYKLILKPPILSQFLMETQLI